MTHHRVGRLNITANDGEETTLRKTGKVIELERPRRLFVETWALKTARGRGLNVPVVLDYSRDEEGHETFAMERIQGVGLNEVQDEAVLADCMFQVGEQLAALKNVSSGFGWVNPDTELGTYESWSEFLVEYAIIYATGLVEEGLLEASLEQKLVEQLRAENLDLATPMLVHRDIKWGNLVLDKTGKVFLIDWENAMLGDSLYDVAIFGVREGHGLPWSELARGLGIDASSKKYALYEAVALVGITEYHRKYETNAHIKAAQLKELIEML